MKNRKMKKIFILDSNVLLHDPTCIFKFEENDIYIPLIVLEEIDQNKTGISETSSNARQISRFIDQLINEHDKNANYNDMKNDYIKDGVRITITNSRKTKGKIFFQTQDLKSSKSPQSKLHKIDDELLGG